MKTDEAAPLDFECSAAQCQRVADSGDEDARTILPTSLVIQFGKHYHSGCEPATCEAETCKRVVEGGSNEFRVILSDHDHLLIQGKHYHLHCAPPAVEVDGFAKPASKENEDAEPVEETVDFLLDRISSIVQEAPQAEREPMLYRAHVLGVLHQARATEALVSIQAGQLRQVKRIAKRLDTLCAELVKPEHVAEKGDRGFTDEALTARAQVFFNGPYLSKLTSSAELLQFLKDLRDELLAEKMKDAG